MSFGPIEIRPCSDPDYVLEAQIGLDASRLIMNASTARAWHRTSHKDEVFPVDKALLAGVNLEEGSGIFLRGDATFFDSVAALLEDYVSMDHTPKLLLDTPELTPLEFD